MKYSSLICPELTDRQLQIAFLVAEFLSNKEIARKLGIHYRVVGEHLTNIFAALGIESRTQLVVWMLKRGLVSLDDIELPTKENIA